MGEEYLAGFSGVAGNDTDAVTMTFQPCEQRHLRGEIHGFQRVDDLFLRTSQSFLVLCGDDEEINTVAYTESEHLEEGLVAFVREHKSLRVHSGRGDSQQGKETGMQLRCVGLSHGGEYCGDRGAQDVFPDKPVVEQGSVFVEDDPLQFLLMCR